MPNGGSRLVRLRRSRLPRRTPPQFIDKALHLKNNQAKSSHGGKRARSGRRHGVRNKLTREANATLAQLCQAHTEAMVAVLVEDGPRRGGATLIEAAASPCRLTNSAVPTANRFKLRR
jgi:hypothetical protein